ncbi:hypothetical protein U0021_03790 [Moraxella canis]|uniref:DUF4230 domain-containing protein n=1 Tax=Moraxella canis TaxID=90239 RepID=A0ABZ0WZP9_9GAMM|nr:hypothetical protein [Moraxella canis]WQE04719.1 hypothetical protein U0021_03790 [Moraxella canis]
MSLSSGSIAVIVVLVVAGFLVGNFMAARPNANEVRVADFRLMARSLGIFPKLIACPAWLKDRYDALKPAKKDVYARAGSIPLIAQYTVIIEDLRLPMAQYHVVADRWQLITQQFYTPKMLTQVRRLDEQPIHLPDHIKTQVLGLSVKANHISLYWLDDKYQHSHKAYKLDKAKAQADLNDIKTQLTAWAKLIDGDMAS